MIWPINTFPLAFVESGASLPCLAFFWSKKGRVWAIFCHFWELPRRKGNQTHVFPCMWKSYGPSKRFHLVWLSQEQGCHAWLFLVKKGPVLSFFLPFLGVAKELKDPNTCFPIHLDVIWPINAFPLALVESGASLPCLASFGPKWTIFGPSPVIHGGHQSKKRLITRSPMCGLLVEPQLVPFGT